MVGRQEKESVRQRISRRAGRRRRRAQQPFIRLHAGRHEFCCKAHKSLSLHKLTRMNNLIGALPKSGSINKYENYCFTAN